MANYPFKINITTKDDLKYSFYTASFATDADTVVSASVMVDRINNMKSGSNFVDSIEAPTSLATHGSTLYGATVDSSGNNGIHWLSASFDHPNTGSITFTDTETAASGGLDFYTFHGSKVCSVLGIPEGIPIYTENFKLSDSSTDTRNYISGEFVSDSVALKKGFKMSSQARMRSNLIWDDAFGEGFVQWVSGSDTKMSIGYDNVADVYRVNAPQITGSVIRGTLTGNVTGNLTGVASNATTLNYIGDHTAIGTVSEDPSDATATQLVFSGSQSNVGNGGDIVLQAGHNMIGNTFGAEVKGGDVVLKPGGAGHFGALTAAGTVNTGSISLEGNTTIGSKNAGGTSLKLGDSTSTYNNWISIRCQDGDETSSGGITFYETSTFSVSAPRYGAKIVYNEATDDFQIGTMHDNSYKEQITIPRASARIEILGACQPVTDDVYDLGSTSFRWDDVRATNGTIQTSDRNLKTQISGSDLGLDFINDLNPVKYQWISGSRPHYGLIAQEVSSSLAKSSVSTDNFAGYVENRMFISGSVSGSEKDIRDTEDWEMENFTSISNPKLSLRYNEFISPMIKAIQELSSQVESLKTQISGSG